MPHVGNFFFPELWFEDTPSNDEVKKGPTSNWAFDRSLKCKVIEIGDWNMDLTPTVMPNHGLTLENIRGVDVLIRSDAGMLYSLISGNTSTTIEGGFRVLATTVVLGRVTGGLFDNTGYDDIPFNRGWIIIWYVA